MIRASGYSIQFLYLLVYSSAIVGLTLSMVLKKDLPEKIDKSIRLSAAAAALFSVIISTQIFVNAVGLTAVLNESSSDQALFISNTITVTAAVFLWQTTIRTTLQFRSFRREKTLLKVLMIATTALWISILAGQAAVLLLRFELFQALSAVQYAAAFIYILTTAAAAAAFFLPSSASRTQNGFNLFRTVLILMIFYPLALLPTGGSSASYLAPAGLFTLNLLNILLLFRRAESGKDIRKKPPLEFFLDSGLSKREAEVAVLLSEGRTYKEISAELFISISTTQTHTGRIYSKLGVGNKTELANLIKTD